MKLDELGFVGRGKSRHRPRNEPSLYGGAYPFVQTGDIKEADLWLNKYTQTYNEKGLAQSKLWPVGTLCITIAANIAETAILKIPACFPDSVVGFVPHPGKADARFVKYYIDTLKVRMQNASKGTTQDNLSVDKLTTFDFALPEFTVQERIASILSAYDDLIENNTRRIKILEQMAQMLYREWFVNFRFPGHERVRMVESELGPVPERWSLKRLENVANVNELSLKSSSAPERIQYIDIASVSTARIEKVEPYNFADAPGRARRIVRHGDIIWSTVRPNRRSYALILNPESNLIVSTGFAVLTARTVPFSYLYYAVTTDEFTNYLTNHATGSAYPAVTGKEFEKAHFVVPPMSVGDRFHEITEPMLNLSWCLHQRNANLRTTRDFLLPKLISGEISVEAADEAAAELIEQPA